MKWTVALALLLAACGTAQPVTEQTTNERSCARQAESDPAVNELLQKAAGSPAFARNNEDLINTAKQDATVACLRGRGVVRGGGVERQRPL